MMTEYQAKYLRPSTTTARGLENSGTLNKTNTAGSGFSSNNHVSPLELTELGEREVYKMTQTHAAHSKDSTITTLMAPKPIVRAAMERSGYWHEPPPNVLYDSPQKRVDSQRERELNASHLDPLTLKRMTTHNAIDGENHGAGPNWGSTTTSTAFHKVETPHERYWKTDRSLIGKKEPNAFTRQHITIPEEPVDEQISVTQKTFQRPPKSRDISFPNRTVMEQSGFSKAAIPTQNHYMPLSDVTAGDLHPIAVQRLKKKNTPEYQNLFDPDPYKSTAQISYLQPQSTKSRALTSTTNVRHGGTGYNSNTTVIAGPPGDARTYKTGKTEQHKKFKDPELGFRGRTQQTANVVERSGYWAT